MHLNSHDLAVHALHFPNCHHTLVPGTPLQDVFLERHGVKLGFMSAFVLAASNALKVESGSFGPLCGSLIRLPAA